MIKTPFFNALLLPLLSALITPVGYAANKSEIDNIVQPLIQKYSIPGMAIAISVDGEHQFYNYGVASKQTQQPITNTTLFEIGSLSKTFTATLASYAQNEGKLSFSDSASHYLPTLKNTSFDNVSLLNLATHTSGLPLFVPDEVTNNTQLMDYYQHWKPEHEVGSYRVYSNLGIGMLGMITANSYHQSFADAMETKMLSALEMKHTYIKVPSSQMADYAQGYNKQDQPVRVTPGPLDAESYGIKSSTVDLIHYLDANMQVAQVDEKWQQAINDTHIGYYKAGPFTQNLMWESYAYPPKLEELLSGNDAGMIMNGSKATAITPPQAAMSDAWYNKTGSTGGFSTYAVFVPSHKIAIIILANKWFPNDERIETAYKIMQVLDKPVVDK